MVFTFHHPDCIACNSPVAFDYVGDDRFCTVGSVLMIDNAGVEADIT
jgi:hypothetical protein